MKTNKTPVDDVKSEEREVLPKVKEIIGSLVAAGGLFVAVLWVAGRVCASGYFEAMNIPMYHTSFSIWEYAEVAWFPLILYSLITVVVISLTAWIIFLLANFVFSRLAHRLEKNIKRRPPKIPNGPRLPAATMFIVAYLAACGLVLLFVVITSFGFIFLFGQDLGRHVVLESAKQIEVITNTPQVLGVPKIISSTVNSTTSTLYVYEGLRLLTYNEGKYYLFREIDPVTCRPKLVYVINEKQYVQVNILAPSSLSSGCLAIATPSAGAQQVPTVTLPAP